MAELRKKWNLLLDARMTAFDSSKTIVSFEALLCPNGWLKAVVLLKNASDKNYIDCSRFEEVIFCTEWESPVEIFSQLLEPNENVEGLCFAEAGSLVAPKEAAASPLMTDEADKKVQFPTVIVPDHLWSSDGGRLDCFSTSAIESSTFPLLATPLPFLGIVFGPMRKFESHACFANPTTEIRETFWQIIRSVNLPLEISDSLIGLIPVSSHFRYLCHTGLLVDVPNYDFTWLRKQLDSMDSLDRQHSLRPLEPSDETTPSCFDPLEMDRFSAVDFEQISAASSPNVRIDPQALSDRWLDDFFQRAVQSLKETAILFVLHQLRKGGAEKQALMHIHALHRLYPERKIGIVLTSPTSQDWVFDLPDGVSVFEWGKELSVGEGLPQLLGQQRLLSLLISLLMPQVVHIIGSPIGWQSLASDGWWLSKKIRFIGQIFCLDFDMLGRPLPNSCTWLKPAAPYLSVLIADNSKVLKDIEGSHSPVRSMTMRYPSEVAFPPTQPVCTTRENGVLRLLWFGRDVYQKDLLTFVGLAWLFPEHQFVVHADLSDHSLKMEFPPNLSILPGFDHFSDIEISEFDALVYTAIWDGLPNVLIEIGSAGLPIICRGQGGLSDLLDDSTATIVKTDQDFVAAIEGFPEAKQQYQEKVKILKDRILKQHSMEQFVAANRELYGEMI